MTHQRNELYMTTFTPHDKTHAFTGISKTNLLRILLTNHHLMSYQGSENFTFIIADFLKKNGHDVVVYSAYLGELKRDFNTIGVRVETNLKALENETFDIAHVHHQINACEIRYYFPRLPIILLCHGINFLETPPILDLKISQYLATSERVLNHMVSQGIPREKILIFRNMVDRTIFSSQRPINQIPKKALVISNKLSSDKAQTIQQACKALKIESFFVGRSFHSIKYKQVPLYINQADIVFSLGRGVIESMFCGRVPVVFDHEGGDGMVTPSTIVQNMTCNFSGNLHNIHYNEEELVTVLQAYRPSDAVELQQIAYDYFAADKQILVLIDIYRKRMREQVEPLDGTTRCLLDSIIQTISETRAYQCGYHNYMMTPGCFILRLERFIKKLILRT